MPKRGRKNCTRCTRWLHVHEFHVGRWRDGQANTLASRCMRCMLEINRERTGAKKRRMRPTRDQVNATRREWYRRKVTTDPDWVANERERLRIYNEGRRRAAGIPPRRLKDKAPGKPKKLDTEPIRGWIEEKLEKVENVELLAAQCGVSAKTISNIYREYDSVSEDVVDLMLINEGSTMLWELYPHLFEEALCS